MCCWLSSSLEGLTGTRNLRHPLVVFRVHSRHNEAAVPTLAAPFRHPARHSPPRPNRSSARLANHLGSRIEHPKSNVSRITSRESARPHPHPSPLMAVSRWLRSLLEGPTGTCSATPPVSKRDVVSAITVNRHIPAPPPTFHRFRRSSARLPNLSESRTRFPNLTLAWLANRSSSRTQLQPNPI